MNNIDDSVYLLDSYGLIYRSYFAFINKPLMNSEGKNVSAVFGFFKSLYSILNTRKPRFFLAALDSIEPTFRHKMYTEYKATREKTPEDLHAQIPVIEEILAALGIPVLRLNGFEADDIIASAAAQAKRENRKCFIISSDKDLIQLVDGDVNMLKPGKTEAWELFSQAEAEKAWGVPPSLMRDLLSLTGDSSDNIPGVKGIGEKTACKLLKEFGSLDGIYADTEKLTGAVKKKIEEGKESAYFSRKLITLSEEAEIKSIDEYACTPLDFDGAARIFLREGLPSLAKMYSQKLTPENSSVQTAAEKSGSGTANAGKKNGDSFFILKREDEQTITDLPQNKGKYSCITAAEKLYAVVGAAVKQGIAAFDCETTGLDTMNAAMAGFSISLKEGEGFYFPLICPEPELGAENPVLINKDDAKKALSKLFSSDILVIMHNGKFDYKIIKHLEYCGNFKCRIFDTMVAAWMLDSDRNAYGMDSLARTVLGVNITSYKDIVPKGKLFSEVPLEIAADYAAEDADITLQLYKKFEPLLKENNLYKLFCGIEMPLLILLAEMELRGIYIDKNSLAIFSQELGEEIRNCEKDIFEIVGHEFNISSPKQLQEVLFEERKLKPEKKTKTGYSTDTNVLEKLASEDAVPARILDYRAITKLKSAYTDSLINLADGKGFVHTSFIQTGTSTGRLSSKNPNLQNIPVKDEKGKRIRSAFQACKGNVLISSDYSQIELVVLAHLSEDENLVSAFNRGIDIHARTASLIFNVEIKDVQPEMRRIAKTINFGVIYGMSAFRLADQLKIPRKQAKDFIDAYFMTYKDVSAFTQKVCIEAEEKGFVETIMGRKRFIPFINSRNKIEKAMADRAAVNTVIQGSAADIVKKAMLKVDSALKSEKLKAGILLQVHDELILECPKTEEEAVMRIVKAEMENIVKLSVPLRVEISSGANWGIV